MAVSQQRPKVRRGRLSRGSDFQRVYRQGKSQANRYLVLYSFEPPQGTVEGESPRLGVSVGRKVGNAVVRNRVKRAIRASFDELAGEFSSGLDYVVLARADVVALIERDGSNGVRDALRELIVDPSGSQSAK